MMKSKEESPICSVIIPVYNGEKWIDRCLESVKNQDILENFSLEISVFNDGSTDNTSSLLKKIKKEIAGKDNITMVVTDGCHPPRGVGHAKNEAVRASSGKFLCFQDIDDVMLPERISLQLEAAQSNENHLIGCQFVREPPESTSRFTRWANELPQSLLTTQVLTSHGPTIIMPTWFCSRSVFDRVGGFDETGRGTPEDLIFFYKHLDLGGGVIRVDRKLLVYTYHPLATTLSISEETIWDLRITRLSTTVLPYWKSFTIWNAGKQGRKLWRSLSAENQQKVEAFCDVDVSKIGKTYRPYSAEDRFSKVALPIRHFRDCVPPFVICVKLDLTDGKFEENLSSLLLEEGKDYVMFS